MEIATETKNHICLGSDINSVAANYITLRSIYRHCLGSYNMVFKIKRTCIQCDEVFELYPSQLIKSPGKFCSRKCKGEWQSENCIGSNAAHWKGGPVERICPTCGRHFKVDKNVFEKGKGVFCSKKCIVMLEENKNRLRTMNIGRQSFRKNLSIKEEYGDEKAEEI